MNKQIFTPERDGFCGAWYPAPKQQTDRAVILMLGDSSEDRMATVGAKWKKKIYRLTAQSIQSTRRMQRNA